MTYCTKQDLIDRFGERELMQLTDRDNVPASVIDDTVVEGHLADAHGVVNGYLAKVYKLPIAPVPPVLTKITADVARYFLHGESAEKDSPVRMAYSDAINWLKDVATGKVGLEAEGVPAAQSGGGQIAVEAPERIFSRDKLAGY